MSWKIRLANAALKYPANHATSMHYVHTIDYLVYGYMQANNSLGAIQAMTEMNTHHPIQSSFPAVCALSIILARITLERRNWLNISQLNIREPEEIKPKL